MAFFCPRIALALTLLPLSFTIEAANFDDAARHHIVQQVHIGKESQAISLYRQYRKNGINDYPMLREIGFSILERDVRSTDPTIQRLALFGISMTADEHAMVFFHDALRSNSPELQLYALQQLCTYHDASAEVALRHAMSSPYVVLRFEAALLMAAGRYPCALSQIESLMQKCPDILLSIFPTLLVEIGSDSAMQHLRKLLMHPSQEVRLAAVHAIAKHPQESFAPYIRTLANQNDPVQAEACAFAFAAIKDHHAVPLLIKLSNSNIPETALAANLALYELGYHVYQEKIAQLALTGNPFAIQALSSLSNQEDLLVNIFQRGDSCIRANAAIALLNTKDKRAPQAILELLSPPIPQPPFVRVFSNGKSLFAYKPAPLGGYDTPEWQAACELSLRERENWLEACYACGEKPFLQLANQLVQRRQNDLIPALFKILQQSLSDDCQKLLEDLSTLPGYPLARNYALLSLLRRGEKEVCYTPLKEWLTQQWKTELFDFRPEITPLQAFDNEMIQTDLKPNETARLFLDALDSLIADQDEASVNLVLEGIENAHRSLHPIFAALLIRLVQ